MGTRLRLRLLAASFAPDAPQRRQLQQAIEVSRSEAQLSLVQLLQRVGLGNDGALQNWLADFERQSGLRDDRQLVSHLLTEIGIGRRISPQSAREICQILMEDPRFARQAYETFQSLTTDEFVRDQVSGALDPLNLMLLVSGMGGAMWMGAQAERLAATTIARAVNPPMLRSIAGAAVRVFTESVLMPFTTLPEQILQRGNLDHFDAPHYYDQVVNNLRVMGLFRGIGTAVNVARPYLGRTESLVRGVSEVAGFTISGMWSHANAEVETSTRVLAGAYEALRMRWTGGMTNQVSGGRLRAVEHETQRVYQETPAAAVESHALGIRLNSRWASVLSALGLGAALGLSPASSEAAIGSREVMVEPNGATPASRPSGWELLLGASLLAMAARRGNGSQSSGAPSDSGNNSERDFHREHQGNIQMYPEGSPEARNAWLAYGRALAERGDPRGELIILDFQIPEAPMEARPGLSQRRGILQAEVEAGFRERLGNPSDVSLTWERGFLKSVEFTRPELGTITSILGSKEAGMLQSIRLSNCSTAVFRGLSEHPAYTQFENLPSLAIGGNSNSVRTMLRHLSSAAVFRDLTRLKVEHIGINGLRLLAESLTLQNLSFLDLGENRIGDEGARVLSESSNLRGLTCLDLFNNQIGAKGARYLSESSNLRGLTFLDLWGNQIGAEGAWYLSESSNLRGLTSLNLNSNQIGAEGVRVLSKSTNLRGLTCLDLEYNQISAEGAWALLNSGNLSKGIKISMVENQITELTRSLLLQRAQELGIDLEL